MYKQFYAILKTLNGRGIDLSKDELVSDYTNGRTKSLKEMTPYEYKQMIINLNSFVSNSDALKEDKMRKKILSIAHELNWTLPNGKIDWPKLNAWLLKYGYLHKELNRYKLSELPQLVSQIQQLLKP
jgi:hypothetical protein